MNATGMVRRIDNLGRMVFPKEMRKNLGLKEGTPMEIFVSEDGIVLKKYYPEKNILELLQQMEESVDEEWADLGTNTVNGIRRNIQEIRALLKHAVHTDEMQTVLEQIAGGECTVCRNEALVSGQRYCQICGNPINWKDGQSVSGDSQD